MSPRILAAGGVVALLLALPAAAQQATPAAPLGARAPQQLATQFSCAQHLKIIDDWMAQHPETTTGSDPGTAGVINMRKAAGDACDRGDERTAFMRIDDTRRMLGMPLDTVAQVDVSKAVNAIREEETAGIGIPGHRATSNLPE